MVKGFAGGGIWPAEEGIDEELRGVDTGEDSVDAFVGLVVCEGCASPGLFAATKFSPTYDSEVTA